MLEKIITLEDISMVDFLGIHNSNIKEVAAAFPESKIISRGNEIRIQGTAPEIIRITDVMDSLIAHYLRYGKVTNDNVKGYLSGVSNSTSKNADDDADVIIYGNKGLVVKAKTANQKLLVEEASKFDLVFAVGPAGTGKTYTAVAIAVRALKNKEVRKIIITRPAGGSRRKPGIFTRRSERKN